MTSLLASEIANNETIRAIDLYYYSGNYNFASTAIGSNGWEN